jgi:hypothetical protein
MTRIQGNLVLALLAAILLALAANVYAVRTTPVTKWEYKIESIRDLEFQRKMQMLGEDGWELTFARRALADDLLGEKAGLYECIFRRPQ